VDDYMSAGIHTITWDGTNEHGNVVSSGIYFYKVVAGDIVTTKKMILMK
jgi:flagellar hook assembly protein FlgD